MRHCAGLFLLLQAAILSMLIPAAGAFADEPINFVKDIKPILKAHCTACHGSLKQEGGLRVDSAALILKGGDSGSAVVSGKSNESELIQRLITDDESLRMPRESKALEAADVEKLRAWIDAGATSSAADVPEADPRDHWAFQRPQRPSLPEVNVVTNARGPVDAFIAAAREAHSITASGEATPEQLLRRVMIDLVGLPPARDELHEFVNDGRPDAYERVVDRLLASPAYGERWGRHWMDVWRYSDWFGRRHVPDVWNSAPQIWRWRDWIIESLNEDKGYDRMIVEMLAADEVAPADDDAGVATGFLIRNWYALNPNQWMRDNVEHTAKAFLGLTFNCAHCHDHKYDPVTQRDYFAFRAFFEPIYIRQDRVPGEDPGPFQDYKLSELRKVVRGGSVRIFDKTLDAKTMMYAGGDERNLLTDEGEIAPGVPSSLGGPELQIEPVMLPPAAYYPGMKDFVRREEIDRRKDAVAKAENDLYEARRDWLARRSVVEAEIAAMHAKRQEVLKNAPPMRPAIEGRRSLCLDAANGRRTLIKFVDGLSTGDHRLRVAFDIEIARDGHASFQFALDVTAGATGGWIGFENGSIVTYKPGGFEQVTVGNYEKLGRMHVTADLDLTKGEMTISVQDAAGGSLVSASPAALNGWRGLRDGKQGILIDAHAGSLIVLDNLIISTETVIEKIDFESPDYAAGEDAVGVDGWFPSPLCASPATSVIVCGLEVPDALQQAEQSVARAERTRSALERTMAAAAARLTGARADLSAIKARISADDERVMNGNPGAQAVNAARLERAAASAMARAAWQSASAELAKAESLPADDPKRKEKIDACQQQIRTATVAREAVELSRAKDEGDYSPLTPRYPKQSTGRRRALATWIASPDNPLTARVSINHLFLRHFHAPLVKSVYDFGRNGSPPSHPELLDWLSVEFMEHGWSMKHIHRQLVSSSTYRLTSKAASDADPDNVWLGRMNSGRMEAEVVRDSILSLAGGLDRRMGGQELENSETFSTFRRTVYYSCNPESDGRSEFGAVFDPPDPTECYRRSRTVVPQQALALANSQLVHEQAPLIAQRIEESIADSPMTKDAVVDYITAAFETILSRLPRELELTECRAFWKQSDDRELRTRLVRVLLNHHDFVTVR